MGVIKPPLLFDIWKELGDDPFFDLKIGMKPLYFRKGKREEFTRENPWSVRLWSSDPYCEPDVASMMVVMDDGVVELIAYIEDSNKVYPMTMLRSRFLNEYKPERGR